MTHKNPPPISGYREPEPHIIEAVNGIKLMEETCLRLCDTLDRSDETDKRWVAIARTQLQQGFMAAVRSVMQPARIKLPGDGE